MDETAIEAAKRQAAERAVEAVSDGDVVGLGTGSTAAFAIRELGRRVDAGLDVRGAPTSYQSEAQAREAGVPITTLADANPDVAIDGADQVAVADQGADDANDGPSLIKGGGAAHARERVVDAAADRFLVVVDERKVADTLSEAVPVEVLPDAEPTVRADLLAMGAEPTLRAAANKDGPVVTDNGNLVLDAEFGTIGQPAALAADVATVPGVVAHGLFVGMTDAVYVGTADGVRELAP